MLFLLFIFSSLSAALLLTATLNQSHRLYEKKKKPSTFIFIKPLL